jgi:hemolysin III
MEKESLGELLANAISHGLGVLFSIGALVVLVTAAETSTALGGVIVFGITLIVLYLASTLYHSFPKSMNKVVSVLRRFDHSAIYFLISGTYTAFVLTLLPNSKGFALLIALWSITFVGTIFKLLWIERFKAVHIILYLAMGWSVAFLWPDIQPIIPESSLTLLFVGGISYTAGMIFFGLRRKYTHFIWHLFVIGGSLAHIMSIYYII